MYRAKIPKSQQADKTPYTAYNPHTIPISERNWSEPFVRIISIDPGTKNFCIRVEERPKDPTSGLIKGLLYERLTLTNQLNEEMLYSVYDVLTEFLDNHLDLFLTCHIVIMERQVPLNYRAVRISQHALSYFMFKLKNNPLLPLIMEIDSKLKGKQLGAPQGINENQLKKWSVQKATELLTIRRDEFSLTKLRKATKKDDLADTVCQIEALFSYLQWPLTQAPSIIKLTINSS